MSDLTLQRAIMEALAQNPHVHADEISVQVRGGDAVLRGTVGSVVQQAEALRTAWRVAGVADVEDELRIRVLGIGGGADADTQAAVLDALIADDEVRGVSRVHNEIRVWLTASADDVAERITDVIGLDAIVGTDDITVDVRDNDVTLTGTVGSDHAHDAALAAAASAPGVAGVHDELSVRSEAS